MWSQEPQYLPFRSLHVGSKKSHVVTPPAHGQRPAVHVTPDGQ